IMAAEATVTATGASFIWRELDFIRVQGRVHPVRVFEPLAPTGGATPDQLAIAAGYAEGLARWRARDFAGAAEWFARLGEADPASAAFLKRAKAYMAQPPGPDWEPVNVLEGK